MERSPADLNEVVVFARVAQLGSFTLAAAALGLPKSTVSRKVAELEARLETRLLQRTTRRVALTDAGRTYFEHCERVVLELEEAERAVGALRERPAGLLRVTAPLSFPFLGPLVADYLQRFPEVQVEMVCTDRVVDLVEERFDLAIRAGPMTDSTLIARWLGSFAHLLVAAPAWVKREGRPKEPADLKERDWLLFGTSTRATRVELFRGRETAELKVRPRLAVNDFDHLQSAVARGLGVGLLPAFLSAEGLEHGTLERVLPAWTGAETPVHAVYPSSRHLSAKVKHFVDHLERCLEQVRWLSRAAGKPGPAQ